VSNLPPAKANSTLQADIQGVKANKHVCGVLSLQRVEAVSNVIKASAHRREWLEPVSLPLSHNGLCAISMHFNNNDKHKVTEYYVGLVVKNTEVCLIALHLKR